MQVRIPDVLDSLYGDECGRDLIEYARGCDLNAFCPLAAVSMLATKATRCFTQSAGI
jgi:hypothetical protein